MPVLSVPLQVIPGTSMTVASTVASAATRLFSAPIPSLIRHRVAKLLAADRT